MPDAVSLDDMIRCVGRELGMRRNVYPRWAKAGRVTQEQADKEIAMMAAVYERLKKIKAEGGS